VIVFTPSDEQRHGVLRLEQHRRRAELLHVLMLPDLERAERIGSYRATMLGRDSMEVG
jgi:hypothetical protein